MPTTTIQVLRVDAVDRKGPNGPFKAYCVTGTTGAEWDHGDFQAQTTSDWAASLCVASKEHGFLLKVLWKDGRYGREMVDATIDTIDGTVG